MPSPRRDRDRRPGRRPPFREPLPIILIVCEGKKTEPEYFRGFVNACQNPRVKIEIAPEHGVPRTLVESARAHKKEAETAASRQGDENLVYDSVWCVFDVDDHPHIADARQMARDNGIELAISNPCFELWLLLHFRESPGIQPRDTLLSMLASHAREYDKGVAYTTYSEGYPQAVERAKRTGPSGPECRRIRA
ncbi:MAG: RloB family protein [Isosphaeraceae bacterium]